MPKIRAFSDQVIYEPQHHAIESTDNFVVKITGSMIDVYSTRSGVYFGYPLIPEAVTPEGPVLRYFPSSSAEWTLRYPGIPVPVAIYPFQDAGPTAVDVLGGKDMATSNASGDERFEQSAPADPTTRFSVLLEDLASNLFSNTADFQLEATASLTVLWRFRSSTGTGASGRFFFRKKDSASGNGWATDWQDANGGIRVYIDSSGDTATGCSVGGDHRGGFFDAMAVIDRTRNVMEMYTTSGSNQTSIASHTSLSNSMRFGVGDTQGNLNAAAQGYYSYAAIWTQPLTASHFNLFTTGAFA